MDTRVLSVVLTRRGCDEYCSISSPKFSHNHPEYVLYDCKDAEDFCDSHMKPSLLDVWRKRQFPTRNILSALYLQKILFLIIPWTLRPPGHACGKVLRKPHIEHFCDCRYLLSVRDILFSVKRISLCTLHSKQSHRRMMYYILSLNSENQKILSHNT